MWGRTGALGQAAGWGGVGCRWGGAWVSAGSRLCAFASLQHTCVFSARSHTCTQPLPAAPGVALCFPTPTHSGTGCHVREAPHHHHHHHARPSALTAHPTHLTFTRTRAAAGCAAAWSWPHWAPPLGCCRHLTLPNRTPPNAPHPSVSRQFNPLPLNTHRPCPQEPPAPPSRSIARLLPLIPASHQSPPTI